ncbi:hypothetical protein DOM21_03220 [Bacteriovorax stolpii]|uniref:Uncharacterized protein n=1 Tax=Bacteriovorax stolpii TaxID=960 RepID=A0A2K9NXM3_BACTC|nr:hypothetical protein [Bacteriovorax stolpii]AUN99524.1 hypothetical protein C0V70_15715 [Bacteriovorax stolpii]QDK40482.1 hypothetical protein DOM21_03220 [Bacteriovorax stolpii]TDP51153.1 hypothetical protein C8D79_3324 [Bacteriovorax stolpii]
MNRYLYGMVVILVVAGIAIFRHLDFGLVLVFTISILAVLAWLKNVNAQKTDKLERVKPKKEAEELFTGEEGEEYHNDFSKVPAGTADEVAPPPRSIGYGYGDGGRSTYEDLERIGIKTKPDKEDKN